MKKFLSKAQYDVMNVIWDHGSAISTKQIHLSLNSSGIVWSISTVQTLLNRLIEKKYLLTQKNGKERYYAALVPRQTFAEEETKILLEKHYSNSVFNMISFLYKNDISTENLAELKKILEEAEKI